MALPVRLLKNSLCAIALLAGAGAALAQAYPSKPLRFVVGFAPGSSIDSVARILADHLRNKLGQPVVVENKTGANGMNAANELARAQPDGYTVLISNSSSITVNPLVYKKITYDVEKQFAPVALSVSVPFILTINPDNPNTANVNNLGDLLKLAKAKQGQLAYGSAGVGNLTQLSMELVLQAAGVQMTHVPYRGSAPAQLGLLGKEVETAFDNPAAMGQIRAGKLKAIAVSSAQRWRDLPDVPSIAEQGYPDFDISFWVGVFVPAGTPAPVINTLYTAIKSAATEPGPKALLEAQGNIQMLDPKQFAVRIKKETEQYAQIIKRANIQLD